MLVVLLSASMVQEPFGGDARRKQNRRADQQQAQTSVEGWHPAAGGLERLPLLASGPVHTAITRHGKAIPQGESPSRMSETARYSSVGTDASGVVWTVIRGVVVSVSVSPIAVAADG